MQANSKLQQFLSNETGMVFPPEVTRTIQAFVDRDQSLEIGVDSFLKTVGASWLSGIDDYRGYEGVAIEGQFPFNTGSDGEAHGWLNLCPEVETFAKPFLTYGPVGGYIYFYGYEVKKYLASTINYYHGHNDFSNTDLNLLHSLGIYPDRINEDLLSFNLGDFPLTRLHIKLPTGYKYAPSRDGAGVCAPVALFNPNVEGHPETVRTAEELYELVSTNSKEGYHATTLLYLKDLEHRLYFGTNPEGVPFKETYLQMIETYEALNRPELVRVIQKNYLSSYG